MICTLLNKETFYRATLHFWSTLSSKVSSNGFEKDTPPEDHRMLPTNVKVPPNAAERLWKSMEKRFLKRVPITAAKTRRDGTPEILQGVADSTVRVQNKLEMTPEVN